MKHPFGFIFVTFPLLLTVVLWILTKGGITVLFFIPLESLIELCGLVGTVLMALSIMLTAKLQIIAKLFGGLDKDYRVHALIGSASFILLLAHPILLIYKALVEQTPYLRFLIIGSNIAYDLGILSLYTLLFSLLFMVAIKLPYHLWKYTHQLLIFTFIFGGMHSFLADSDIREFLPLQIHMLSLYTLGVTCGLYTLFLYERFGESFKYTVETISSRGDIIEIYLKPLAKQLIFTPGEFIFIRFINPHISRELHPFTPSSSKEEKLLRLSIKPSGDYTKILNQLKAGDKAVVFGPFGTFGNIYNKLTPHMVWIAGGIGITPFLSMLHEESLHQKPGSITFFYSHHAKADGVYTDEISQLLTHTPRVKFYDWETETKHRLTADEITKRVPNISDCIILLCGPRPFMQSLENQLVKKGIIREHIIYEDFSFL